MGWFDSFSFLPSLYGGQRSRGHIPRSQSDDAVPLRRDSTTEANRGISSTSPSRSNVDTTSYIPNGDDESTTLEHWIVPPEHIEQSQADVEVSNNPRSVDSACSDPHVPSSELKQSKRLSRGLAGFMTFFRRDKARHDLSISIPAHKSRRPAISSILFKDKVSGTTGDACDSEDTRLHTQHSQRVGHHGVECLADDASRKVSDQTILSEESARTSATVSHHPLKRTPHPVTTGYPNYVYEKPFDGIQGISSSVIEPTPPGPSKCAVGSMKPSSSECSDDESQIIYRAATIPEELRHHTPRNHPFIPTSTPRETSRREVSGGSTVSSLFDQKEAAVAFNRVAERLGLQPLKLDCDDVRTVSNQSNIAPEETLPRHRERFLGKIRTMRSNMSMKTPPDASERTLRRIKTLANISSRPLPMTSLKGRSLETLARLGGHSFLTLPADFVPTTLKLPVCFVATATFLRCHAPGVRNVFLDKGSMRVATNIYDHFANQVLSAERENDTIQMTMRGSDMPPDLIVLNRSSRAKDTSQVQAVACVFKSLLAGLPGGVLGSVTLYNALASISRRPFSESEFNDGKSYLGGLTPASSAKVHAITLAVLAMTSEMQLELICAVFGLCTVLLYETKRVTEFQRLAGSTQNHRPVPLTGLLNLNRLSRFFSLVLIDPSMEHELQVSSTASAKKAECETVTRMLIENWRNVSRLLKVWAALGYPARRAAVPWTACNDKGAQCL